MLIKCGVQIMPLLLEKLLNYMSGGANYPHKVSSMATLPKPPKHLATATASFADTSVQITSEGRPYLGAAFGTEKLVTSHVKEKVAKWMKEQNSLVTIALSQPHATHAAFTTVYPAIKWSYLTCTTEGIGTLFQPLETIIRSKLTPAPTGQPPGADLDLKDRGGIVHERSTRVKNLGAWLCYARPAYIRT